MSLRCGRMLCADIAMAIIGLKTRRPSAVLRRVLMAQPDDVEVRVDRKLYAKTDLPWLIDEWCINSNIAKTIDFEIRRGGRAVFGFHDSMSELWADDTERDLVERLVEDKLVTIDALRGPE